MVSAAKIIGGTPAHALRTNSSLSLGQLSVFNVLLDLCTARARILTCRIDVPFDHFRHGAHVCGRVRPFTYVFQGTVEPTCARLARFSGYVFPRLVRARNFGPRT